MKWAGFVLAVATVLAACGSDTNKRDYPAEVRRNFLQACELSGGSADSCFCTLEEIEQRYDLAEFISAESSYSATGVLPVGMAAALAECV